MLRLASIRARFATHRPLPRTANEEHARQAAVAVLLRERAGHAEMLFIKRAATPSDPWSGHMAFPGGHRDQGDAHLRATAVRETEEEIGLDMSCASFLGELPRQRPLSMRSNLLVAPFVFAIDGDPRFALNREVAATVWTPLAPMHLGRNAERASPSCNGARSSAGAGNGFRLAGGYFVWGMTYRMVQTFFETVDPDYQPLPG